MASIWQRFAVRSEWHIWQIDLAKLWAVLRVQLKWTQALLHVSNMRKIACACEVDGFFFSLYWLQTSQCEFCTIDCNYGAVLKYIFKYLIWAKTTDSAMSDSY